MGGLFKFFSKLATEADKKHTRDLWLEGRNETFTQGQGFGQASDVVQRAKQERAKDLARARKQKQRANEKASEIARGERSPGGRKRKVIHLISCGQNTETCLSRDIRCNARGSAT
jgi:hypothetical protein